MVFLNEYHAAFLLLSALSCQREAYCGGEFCRCVLHQSQKWLFSEKGEKQSVIERLGTVKEVYIGWEKKED